MKSFTTSLVVLPILFFLTAAQNNTITLTPAATGFEGDNTAFIYNSDAPLLTTNDGSAADGGFRTFSVSNSPPFNQTSHQKSGRSKIALPVHDIGGRDVIFNIPAPDSRVRIFDAESGEEVQSNGLVQLGDWSTACLWRSKESAESYVLMFGKRMAVQFLVREGEEGNVEVLEVCLPLLSFNPFLG